MFGHLAEVVHATFLNADARAHVTGAAAVEVFVLISGFVIAALVLPIAGTTSFAENMEDAVVILVYPQKSWPWIIAR